ncbi:hypothetical protein NLU13_1879 [Sarocladium strictum]|uniref:Uncharacterized protein n=1 Tax=Sarocladium strictum TaxID=5046 RepID=A0AA39GSJ3_SARSR|nr:hypothetical protein NLU13_1879 [Sarocladium strictum]
MAVVEYERPKKRNTKKTQTKQARGQREDGEALEDNPVNLAEDSGTSDGALDLPTQPPSQPSEPKTPYEPNPWKRQSGSGLMSKLHLEIRQMIWREVLVAPEPVLLIRVCKALYEEGLPILYGQNTFRYLIRDTVNTTATLTNINHPALTVGNPGFIDDTVADDSGSDWERDCGPDSARRNNNPTKRMTRSAARQKKSAEVADINVEKFAHLFRHLMIEAESNRYDQDIQERMSEAIEVFKFKDGADDEAGDGGIAQGGGTQRLIVNTLTIRVTPQRLRDSVHGYTFVDFFDQGSAVINAVKNIDCQLFRIEIFRPKQNSDENRDRAMCQRGEDLTAVEVDFFHQRAAYNIHKFGEKDLWANDPVAKQQRMKGIQRGRLLLDNLAENVKKACRSLEGPPAVDQ